MTAQQTWWGASWWFLHYPVSLPIARSPPSPSHMSAWIASRRRAVPSRAHSLLAHSKYSGPRRWPSRRWRGWVPREDSLLGLDSVSHCHSQLSVAEQGGASNTTSTSNNQQRYSWLHPRSVQSHPRFGLRKAWTQNIVSNTYKWKNHFYEMKGDVGMSKKKGTRCLHQDTKPLITPSLHLCFALTCCWFVC